VNATKFALYVKSNTKRGGFSQNINLDSVSGVFARAFVYVTTTYNSQTGSHTPKFGPFYVSNSSCTKASKVLDVSGLAQEHVKGLEVRDSRFAGVGSTTNTVKNVDGLKFTNVTANGKPMTN